MDAKRQATERLRRLELMEGVLPTKAVRTKDLARTAESIRSMDFSAATTSAQLDLKERSAETGATAATDLFAGGTGLREQAAGFAEAGINFFFASRDLIALPLHERSARGASGVVSRVFVSNQRILLETERLVVRFATGTGADKRAAVLQAHALVEIGSDGMPPDAYRVAATRATATSASLALMDDDAVLYAEPDFLEHIGHRHTPTDPKFAQQWHHAKIGAPEAWDVTHGGEVSVAVIDNGFDTQHPDLAFGSLSGWFRPTPDQMDADFVHGVVGMESGDHGTACAGMIASPSGNGVGGCGVAFGAKLSMIACLGDQVGTQTTLARAIGYAAKPSAEASAPGGLEGADIIVCSLGPNGANWEISETLSLALNVAGDEGRGGKGCAILWACTNGNYPIGSDKVCSHRKVMAIGRSRADDNDDGSGYGPELEMLAPGVDVYIPAIDGGYQTTTGTSFAAPCAAAVAALALSQNMDLSAVDLRQLLRDSCDKVGSLPYIEGRNTRFGHGRINAKTAVDLAKASAPSA